MYKSKILSRVAPEKVGASSYNPMPAVETGALSISQRKLLDNSSMLDATELAELLSNGTFEFDGEKIPFKQERIMNMETKEESVNFIIFGKTLNVPAKGLSAGAAINQIFNIIIDYNLLQCKTVFQNEQGRFEALYKPFSNDMLYEQPNWEGRPPVNAPLMNPDILIQLIENVRPTHPFFEKYQWKLEDPDPSDPNGGYLLQLVVEVVDNTSEDKSVKFMLNGGKNRISKHAMFNEIMQACTSAFSSYLVHEMREQYCLNLNGTKLYPCQPHLSLPQMNDSQAFRDPRHADMATGAINVMLTLANPKPCKERDKPPNNTHHKSSKL